MKNLLWKFLSGAVLMMVMLILTGPPTQAQDQCTPISGTIYGCTTDEGWMMTGGFTISRKVYHATISVDGGPLLSGNPFEDEVWTGTETWTFDFGMGNKI
jgi:hypothetical protein